MANVNAVEACPTTTTAICQFAFPGTYQIRRFPLRFDTLRADNLNQADVGLQREFQLPKMFGVFELRMEAINVLNHPVFGSPASTVTTQSSLGQISTLAFGNAQRILQFAAKLQL